jgi:hypothetical protein
MWFRGNQFQLLSDSSSNFRDVSAKALHRSEPVNQKNQESTCQLGDSMARKKRGNRVNVEGLIRERKSYSGFDCHWPELSWLM